jgi:hypothetical protein
VESDSDHPLAELLAVVPFIATLGIEVVSANP